MKTPIVDEWQGCYPSQWRGIITQEAIVHPAKFSNKLIRRIYEHMLSQGWLKEGDSVIDPFGGVALGAFDAMRLGLNWYGSELEKKFVELGNGNIQLWKKRYTWWKGNAILLQGDSRHLIEVLGTVSHKGAISSPPYAVDALGHAGGEGPRTTNAPHTSPGTPNSQSYHMEATISSPPYADSLEKANGIDASKLKGGAGPNSQAVLDPRYSAAGAISSPPFTDSLHDVNVQQPAGRLLADELGESNSAHISPIDMEKIGKRGKTGYSGSISSPPYSDGCQHTGGDTPTSADHIAGGDVHLPGIQGVLSSPPYSEARVGQESGQEHCGNGDQYGATPGQLGAMKSGGFEAALASPPYAGMQVEKSSSSIDYAKQYEVYKKSGGGQSFEAFVKTQELHSQGYGDSEGQLSSMPKGDFNAAITSPPFRQQSGGAHIPKGMEITDPGLAQRHAAGNASSHAYGESAGQLANMGEGDFDAAVTSPPYEGTGAGDQGGQQRGGCKNLRTEKGDEYGITDGQIGNTSGDDFWSAARTIVEQTFLALVGGGHAVWVVKGFVKNKELVDFPGQWRQLCEAVGFETLHEHHAMLVHKKGTSVTFEGEKIEHRTESKSFFRRLAEKRAAKENYWKSLDRPTQAKFIWAAHRDMWDWYNGLTTEEKAEITDGEFHNPAPSRSRIMDDAWTIAFEESGETEETWNASTRIDYETIFCMVKPIHTLGSEVESDHE